MNPGHNAKILRFETLGSTNSFLRENIETLENRTVAAADIQTDGRGRRGRNWNNNKTVLMFSVLEKNALYPHSAGMAASIAVIIALDKLYGIKTHIKWPNDIVAENLKVCGILCESLIRCDSNGKNVDINNKIDIICGIGINVSTKKEFFIENSLPYAGSIKSVYNIDADFDILLDGILSELFPLLDSSFTDYKAMYEEKCITLNREIIITSAIGTVNAKAKGISEEGYLICENISGEKFYVNSGEVSVRGLYGYI